MPAALLGQLFADVVLMHGGGQGSVALEGGFDAVGHGSGSCCA